MDVILDSNIYIQVILREGSRFVQTTQFAELFSYLRRTDSPLVIPLVVFFEVVERYRERLSEKIVATRKEWNNTSRLLFANTGSLSLPRVNIEVEALRQLLRNPGQGVRSLIDSRYDRLDVWEGLRRGIKRIPPASANGEELRDVLLWLQVLDYTRQKAEQVAFISNDTGFVGQDETQLHPHLQQDLAEHGVQVGFFRSIRDFVTHNALESEAVTAEWLSQFVQVEELRPGVERRLLGTRLKSFLIKDTQVGELTLVEAQNFRVGANSFYVEARFSGNGTVSVSEEMWVNVGQFEGIQAVLDFQTPELTANFPSARNLFVGPRQTFQEFRRPTNLALFPGPSGVLKPESRIAQLAVEIQVRVSLRIIDDRLENLQIDDASILTLNRLPGS